MYDNQYCGSGLIEHGPGHGSGPSIERESGSIKDVQATGDPFSPQNTSSTSKDEIYELFLFYWVIFALLVTDPIRSGSVSTTLHVTQFNLNFSRGHAKTLHS